MLYDWLLFKRARYMCLNRQQAVAKKMQEVSAELGGPTFRR